MNLLWLNYPQWQIQERRKMLISTYGTSETVPSPSLPPAVVRGRRVIHGILGSTSTYFESRSIFIIYHDLCKYGLTEITASLWLPSPFLSSLDGLNSETDYLEAHRISLEDNPIQYPERWDDFIDAIYWLATRLLVFEDDPFISTWLGSDIRTDGEDSMRLRGSYWMALHL